MGPELSSERSRFARRKALVEFAVHMDNSISQYDKQVPNPLDNANVVRPGARSGLWFLEMLEHRITDRQLQSRKEALDAVTQLWAEVTLKS
jgi:hypothetical protein